MDQDPDTIRQVIADTREDLADTIAALGEKADIKARVSEKAHGTAEEVVDKTHAVVDQIQEAVPDQVGSAVSVVSTSAQEAGRWATDSKKRVPIIAGVVVLVVLLAFLRRWRNGA